MNLIDMKGGKGSLWNDFSCASNLDVLAADISPKSSSNSHDPDGFVKAEVDQWEVALPVVNAHLSENVKRALLRIGPVFVNRAVDLAAHLLHPVGIYCKKAENPGSIPARVELARENGKDDPLVQQLYWLVIFRHEKINPEMVMRYCVNYLDYFPAGFTII